MAVERQRGSKVRWFRSSCWLACERGSGSGPKKSKPGLKTNIKPASVSASVLLAGKIEVESEGAAQDSRRKRRGPSHWSFRRRRAHGLNLSVAGGKPVRIWVADEHRYGSDSGGSGGVGACAGYGRWRPYQTKYEWSYLYSALEADGEHAAEFLCLPGVSLEMSHLFLAHLSAQDPQAEHVVIWDQAGFIPGRVPLACQPTSIWVCPYHPTVRN